ncbi:MAG: limonene-1,2-epoxide hydrolase [Pseudonocardiaceae bacterium]|nr:limonene-1,2-epoxide hydrolase [Pseudonocardiaceae bacterium]
MAETASQQPNAPEQARALDTVTDFLAALEDLDIELALSYAAPDIVYQNVPLPPARGIKAFGRQMRAMAKIGTGFQARVHHIAANGSVVLTERTDVLEIGSWRAEFWVCGTFELRDGRIVLWRDYFDWATLLSASARGAVDAVASGIARRLNRG